MDSVPEHLKVQTCRKSSNEGTAAGVGERERKEGARMGILSVNGNQAEIESIRAALRGGG